MKSIRSLAVAAAVLAMVPAAGMAQSARPFQNSWFWGLKAGGTFMSAPSQANLTSPMAGIDWLITRNRGGLYVSFDQSFFTQHAVIADSVQPTDTPSRLNLTDLRRVTVALMGYPGDNPNIHPYAGLGITYNQVGSVKPSSPYGSDSQYSLAQSIIAQYKSVFSPVVMLGAQFQVRNAALFVQGMGWTANSQFFIYNARGFNASLEAGVRYNFGSSVEIDR